jgi:hypothetical protein
MLMLFLVEVMIKIKTNKIKHFQLYELSFVPGGMGIGGIAHVQYAYASTQSDRMWFKYRLRTGD